MQNEPRTRSGTRCTGQAMVEYLVATAVVVTVFFGEPDGTGSSLASMLARAIQTGYAGFYTALSVPN